jgi:hypothetical protein
VEAQTIARRAIGAVTDRLDGPDTGSAFAVTAQYAVTAFHVVGDRTTGQVTAPQVRIRFTRDAFVEATVVQKDPGADLALLRLDTELPAGFEPVPLARAGDDCRDADFSSSGFPTGRSFLYDAIPLTGKVSEPFATIFDGVPAIALASGQAQSGMPMRGFSGAPIIIDLNRADPSQPRLSAAIAAVRWMPLEDAGGQFYGAPCSTAWAWPEVKSAFVEAAATRPPHETAVRNFMNHYVGRADQPVAFGGRQAELARLDSWLSGPDTTPFMLVTGPAGRGKSSLLVRWTERLHAVDATHLKVIFVPVTIRWGLNTSDAVFRALAGRLRPSAGNADNPVDRVAEILREDQSEGEQLLVVLDGIDEADGWDATPAILPHDLGHGVRVVIGARLTADRPGAEHWFTALDWSPRGADTFSLPPLTGSGVQEAMDSLGPPVATMADSDAARGALYRVSEGDPLVLSLYLAELVERHIDDPTAAVALLKERPPGLTSYLNAWWQDQERLWGKDFAEQHTTVRMIVNVLACALGPLQIRDIKSVTSPLAALDGDGIGNALRILRRLVLRDTASGYSLSHPRLADHRRAQLRETDELVPYDQLFNTWGRSVVADLEKGTGDPATTSNYLLHHYCEHLERVQAPARDFLPLLGLPWRQSWEAVSEEYAGHCRDLSRVRSAIATVNRSAVARGAAPELLAEQFRCAFLAADARLDMDLISPQFATQLFMFGRWHINRVLALIRALPEDGARVQGLTAVAPSLPAGAPLDAAQELLSQLTRTDPLVLGPAFAEMVSAWCRHGHVDRALRMVQEQPPGFARGLGALRLASLVQDDVRSHLLRGLSDDLLASGGNESVDLLVAATAAIPRTVAEQSFAGADRNEAVAAKALLCAAKAGNEDPAGPSDAVGWSAIPSYWLAALAPWLPVETLNDALECLVTRLEANGGLLLVHPALEDLAALLPDQLTERAIDLTEANVKYESWRIAIFAQLLPKMVPARRAHFIDWIAERLEMALDKAGNSDERAALFGALRGAGLIEMLLDTLAHLDEDHGSVGDYLTDLSPMLTEAQARRALGIAMHARHETRSQALSAVLTTLASFSAETAEEALGVATSHRGDRDEIAATDAALNANPAEGLRHALGIGDESLRYAALAVLALHGGVTGAYLDLATRSFGRDWAGSNRLALATFDAVFEQVADTEIASPDCMKAVADAIQSRVHERKHQILIRYFARLERLGLRQQALRLAASLSTSSFGLPMDWAVAGIGEAAQDLDPFEMDQQLLLYERPRVPMARAALLRHRSHEDRPEEWSRLLELVSPRRAQIDTGNVRAFVELLPGEYRRRTLDHFFPCQRSRNSPGLRG